MGKAKGGGNSTPRAASSLGSKSWPSSSELLEDDVGVCSPHLVSARIIERQSRDGRDSPSWYSSAEIHIFLNVLSPARMDPPIQVEYLRSGGALIRILVSRSASFLTSCRRRSPNPARTSARQRLPGEGGTRDGGRTLDERATTAEDDVAEERFAQVEVGAVDRVDDDLVHARVLEADNLRVEQELGRAMPFGAELHVPVSASVRASSSSRGKKRTHPDYVAVW